HAPNSTAAGKASTLSLILPRTASRAAGRGSPSRLTAWRRTSNRNGPTGSFSLGVTSASQVWLRGSVGLSLTEARDEAHSATKFRNGSWLETATSRGAYASSRMSESSKLTEGGERVKALRTRPLMVQAIWKGAAPRINGLTWTEKSRVTRSACASVL